MEPETRYLLLPEETLLPPDEPVQTELHTIRGRLCECVRVGNGYTVRRVLSTDPADYLDPALAPGTAVYPPFAD